MVQPGLSNVYLHLMYKKAQTEKLPLLEIKDFINKEPLRFSIHSKLQALFLADHITPKDADKLRNEYVHMSHRDWEDANEDKRWIANRPELDGIRTIYYNKPSNAVVPQPSTKKSGKEKS